MRRCFIEGTASQPGIDEGKPNASRVLGLDEFSVKKRMFDTTISDLEGRKRLLFHSRYLLLRKAESLNPEEQLRPDRLFSFYPELV